MKIYSKKCNSFKCACVKKKSHHQHSAISDNKVMINKKSLSLLA